MNISGIIPKKPSAEVVTSLYKSLVESLIKVGEYSVNTPNLHIITNKV